MWKIKKTVSISSSHRLPGHEKCGKDHGHNYIITVYCESDKLTNGMVTDFGDIKWVVNRLDHECLNDFMENPTAENIAKYVFDRTGNCTKVEVQETRSSSAEYSR